MHYLFTVENIIIQIFIAIPLYFLIRLSLGRIIKPTPYKTITTILTTLILTPIIKVGQSIFFFLPLDMSQVMTLISICG
jgi:hypothetical protein